MPQTTVTTTRLREMTSTTPTALWNDSCSVDELASWEAFGSDRPHLLKVLVEKKGIIVNPAAFDWAGHAAEPWIRPNRSRAQGKGLSDRLSQRQGGST